MAANTFTQWGSANEPPGMGTAASMGPSPVWRNSKDQLLSGYRTGVEEQYPDGYLGTMSSNRRQDKILGTLSRMNARQYSRGVHKVDRKTHGNNVGPQNFNIWQELK